jgi:plastocyanin
LTRMPTFLVIGAAAAALAVAGCGGGGGGGNTTSTAAGAGATGATGSTGSTSSGGGGGGETLDVAAVPSGALAFDKKTLTAKAGKVTIKMSNPSPVVHGVAIEGNGVDQDGKTVPKGGTSTVTVTLKPGTYTFYCPVPGHKQGGMKGTLTVQ